MGSAKCHAPHASTNKELGANPGMQYQIFFWGLAWANLTGVHKAKPGQAILADMQGTAVWLHQVIPYVASPSCPCMAK